MELGMHDPIPNSNRYTRPPPEAWDGCWPNKSFIDVARWVRRLWIDGSVVKSLPEWLGDLPHLKELYITGGTHIPEEVQAKPQLEIPISIAHAKELEKIELRDVHLAPLPDEFGQMKQLQDCWIENCRLTALPLAIQNLTNLQVLRIVELHIQKLPPIFSKMKKLTLLSMIQTDIDELPNSFRNCWQLKNIVLIDHHLNDLPPSFKYLINLESLSLIGNVFTEVPPILQKLPRLQSLSIGRNQIQDLPEWLGQIRPDGSFLFELAIDELPAESYREDEARLRRDYPHFFRPPNSITRFPEWIRNSRLEQVTLGIVLRSLYGLPPKAMVWAALDTHYQPSHYALPNTVIQWVEEAHSRTGEPLSPIPEHWQPVFYDYEIGGNRHLFFDFSGIDTLRERLLSYYALAVEEIAVKLVKTKTITAFEQERLLHECTPDVRAYIDSNLPPDHPIALALTENAKINMSNSYSILL